MLAVRILQEQGIEVTGLSFKSHFFGIEKAKLAAQNLGIKLIEADFSAEHLAMVKNPPHGYGKNMNPCIDCHGMMLRKAKAIMEKEGFDFLATGEVLGQRPMSQNKDSLDLVAKISGLDRQIVRPLSAKLLEETEPEKDGLVLRRRLFDISGRSRDRQMELAGKYRLTDYPSPAGGCLLTDPEFSQRLIKLFDAWPETAGDDVELLKNGRIFWLNRLSGGKTLLVIGRNKQDNECLEKLAKKADIMIELEEKGPTALIRNSGIVEMESASEIDIPQELHLSELKLGEEKSGKEIFEIAMLLTGYHAPKARGKKTKMILKFK